jgi:hypothetical protein
VNMKIPSEYVVVPRAVCKAWWPKPYSEIRAAAEAGVDGIELAQQPKKLVPDPKSVEKDAMKEVDDYPYIVRGAMVFREAGRFEGFNREDVATLHTQGW